MLLNVFTRLIYFLNFQCGASFIFRVAAFNEVGISDYSEMPLSVEVIDKLEAPQILDDVRNVTVKAGNAIR